MTTEEFIQCVGRAVYEPSIDGTIGILEQPPGRKPHERLVALSHWFNQLPTEQRAYVQSVIELVAHGTVFGMLAVLDGVRSVNRVGEEGTLELRHVTREHSTLLNDPEGMLMHDLFSGQFPCL